MQKYLKYLNENNIDKLSRSNFNKLVDLCILMYPNYEFINNMTNLDKQTIAEHICSHSKTYRCDYTTSNLLQIYVEKTITDNDLYNSIFELYNYIYNNKLNELKQILYKNINKKIVDRYYKYYYKYKNKYKIYLLVTSFHIGNYVVNLLKLIGDNISIDKRIEKYNTYKIRNKIYSVNNIKFNLFDENTHNKIVAKGKCLIDNDTKLFNKKQLVELGALLVYRNIIGVKDTCLNDILIYKNKFTTINDNITLCHYIDKFTKTFFEKYKLHNSIVKQIYTWKDIIVNSEINDNIKMFMLIKLFNIVYNK